MCGCQIVVPLGLSILQAIFARCRLAANPIEQVTKGPTPSETAFLILSDNPSGSAISRGSSLQQSSSIDLTASTGITLLISARRALCARRYKSGLWHYKTRSGQTFLASDSLMTFLTPRALASFEQAMTTVCTVPSKGTMPTGLPRRPGLACCSTDAKKPSKSR